MENLIGKKIRGFRFETEVEELNFHPDMDKYIGEIGEIGEIISHYPNDSVEVKFKDDIWCYPLPEALEYLVEEEPIIPELGEGVLMEVSVNGKNWYNRVVIAKYQDFYIGSNLTYWKHVRPIPRPIPVKKVTRAELEALVGGKFEIVNEK